jgi:hypothetical protein
MTWTDGSVYNGDWIRGIQHGKGKMKFPDGSEKEGYFENNVFTGEQPPRDFAHPNYNPGPKYGKKAKPSARKK